MWNDIPWFSPTKLNHMTSISSPEKLDNLIILLALCQNTYWNRSVTHKHLDLFCQHGCSHTMHPFPSCVYLWKADSFPIIPASMITFHKHYKLLSFVNLKSCYMLYMVFSQICALSFTFVCRVLTFKTYLSCHIVYHNLSKHLKSLFQL